MGKWGGCNEAVTTAGGGSYTSLHVSHVPGLHFLCESTGGCPPAPRIREAEERRWES